MNTLYQLRVYGHHIDFDGVRENQLVGPIYTDKDIAYKDAKALMSGGFYYNVEVEEQTIATTTQYC